MILTHFVNYLATEKRYSRNTIEAYQRDLRLLAEFLSRQYDLSDWNSVQPNHLRSWIVSMSTEGMDPSSISRKISSVRHLFRFLRKTGQADNNPAQRLVAPRVGKRLPDVVDAVSLKRLWDEELFSDDWKGWRDRILLTLLYTTGMRRGELLSLEWKDIDLSQRQIKVMGKGSKERWIPLTNNMATDLARFSRLLKENGAGEVTGALIRTDSGKPAYPRFIYNKVQYYLRQISSASKCSPHVLRHSFATHLSDGGADLQAIRELLGHANLAATQIYTHNSAERLKKVYQQAHPKSGKD